MFKKIMFVLIAAALIVVAGMGTRETEAWFSDSEVVSGLTIKTGYADLKLKDRNDNWVNSASGGALGISLPDNLYPGYEGNWNNPDGVLVIGNRSSDPIILDVAATIQNYSQSKGVAQDIYMAIAWEGNATGTGFYTLKYWKEHSKQLGPSLEGNRVLKIYFKVPGSAGNNVSGATVNFDLQLYAQQHH